MKPAVGASKGEKSSSREIQEGLHGEGIWELALKIWVLLGRRDEKGQDEQ